MVLDWLLGLLLIGVMALAMLTIAAIIEVALEYFETDEVLVIDTKTTAELERVAKMHGSKPHKRFVFDKRSKQAVLVESNHISEEMKNEELITVDIR